jgi:predicted PurR-regulated permease PerM
MDSSWSKSTRIIVVLALVAAGIWLAFLFAPLLEAVIVAGLLAYLLDPIVRWMMAHSQATRGQAAGFVFAMTILLLIGIPAVLGTVAFNWLSRLGTDLVTAIEEIELWLFQPIDLLGFRLQPQDVLDRLQGFGAELLAALPGGSLDVLSSVTTNLVWALGVIVIYYYLLKDGPKIRPWLISLLPEEHRPELTRLSDEVNWVWSKFLRVQVLMFLLLFVLMVMGTLLIVGLFRSGLLRWSPIGFILLLLLWYTAIQQLDNLWLRPQILGRKLELHPGIVFTGLVGALMLSGLLGALLIVPVLGTVKVVGRYVHRKLLGLPPWPEGQPVLGAEEATTSSPVAETAASQDAALVKESDGRETDEERDLLYPADKPT